MSVVTPPSELWYFIAGICKPIKLEPLLAVIAKPCCTVLSLIPLNTLANEQLLGGTVNDALKKSVKDVPCPAVPIGWKFVPSTVPIAFSKSPLVAKSKTEE